MSPTFQPTTGKILGTMPHTIPGAREECLDATDHIVDTIPWFFPRGGGIPASVHSPTSTGPIHACVGHVEGGR